MVLISGTAAGTADRRRDEVVMNRMPQRDPFAGVHARAGVSFLSVAVILAATGVSVNVSLGALVPEQRGAVAAASVVVGFLAVWVALPVGMALLCTAGEPPRWRRILAAIAAVAAPVLVQLSGLGESWLLIPIALAAAVTGYVVISIGLVEHRSGSRRWARPAIVVLTAANLVVIGLATLHLLVWNPLSKLPGFTLDQIYATLGEWEDGVDATPAAAAIAATLVTLASAAATLVAVRRGRVTTHQIVTGGLVLVHATTFLMWWAGFGLGMDLADAFATSGGDAAPTGWLLALGGTGCLVTAILLQLRVPADSESGPDDVAWLQDDEDADADADLRHEAAAAPTGSPTASKTRSR
jgi:hypothetical protein